MTILDDFSKALKSVTKTLHKEKKRRERDARAVHRTPHYSYRTTIKEAVFEVLPAAAAAASGDGKYVVPSRSLFYQVRQRIQQIVPDELKGKYFSQDLLTAYQEEFGPIEGLTRDPRGVLHEPHTGKTVPLGTCDVGSYEFPSYVYDKILYVEKEGLTPIWKEAQLAERYDLAIAAGKGQPTEAVRELFARAEAGDYKLFVLHDADPAGYSIARTIAEETKRMPDHNVDVIDLGLTVADAIALELPTETFTRKAQLPYWMSDRLTEQEQQWFHGRLLPSGRLSRRQWECTRVELNALTAPQLVEFIETGLAKNHAAKKVVPPLEFIRETAAKNHRDHIAELVEQALAEIFDSNDIVETLVGETARAAKPARNRIVAQLKDNPPEPWRDIVQALVDERLDDKKLQERVREIVGEVS